MNIPSHISCFCLVPLARTTENGVTPGAQLNQALQKKLFTVDQKGQSQIPDEKPHRGLSNRDTTCGLESTTGKTQTDFTGKGQHACPDVCYLLEREIVHSLPVWTCVLLQDQRDNTNSLLSAHKNLCKGMTQLGLSPFSQLQQTFPVKVNCSIEFKYFNVQAIAHFSRLLCKAVLSSTLHK